MFDSRGGTAIGRETAGGTAASLPARSRPPARPSGRRSARPAPEPRPPTYPAFVPMVVGRPGGGLCLGEERRRYESESTAVFVNGQQEQRWLRLANRYDLCRGVTRPGDTSPAGQAGVWWRLMGEDLLHVPRPVIAPGWMLAGKRAHLEANVPLSATYRHDTPLGPITIEARGELYVDWGDGDGDGPFDHAGAPGPTAPSPTPGPTPAATTWSPPWCGRPRGGSATAAASSPAWPPRA